MTEQSPLRILERFVLPAVVGILVVTLMIIARDRLQDTARFVVDPAWVQVLDAPDWMSPDLADQVAIEVAAALDGPARLMEAEGLGRWRENLAVSSAWVAAVPTVSPRFPYQADVELVLRRPVLDLGDGRLVAADGAVMWARPEAIEPRPVRFGGARVGHAGAVDADVLECAAALGDLMPLRPELEGMGLKLSEAHLNGDGVVVLRTAGGVLLEWGRPSRGPMAAYDIPPSGRLENLRQVLDSHPGLGGLARVTLWLDRPTVVPGP